MTKACREQDSCSHLIFLPLIRCYYSTNFHVPFKCFSWHFYTGRVWKSRSRSLIQVHRCRAPLPYRRTLGCSSPPNCWSSRVWEHIQHAWSLQVSPLSKVMSLLILTFCPTGNQLSKLYLALRTSTKNNSNLPVLKAYFFLSQFELCNEYMVQNVV